MEKTKDDSIKSIKLRYKEVLDNINIETAKIDDKVKELLTTILGSGNGTPYLLNEFFQLQVDVPILELNVKEGYLDSWCLYLADIGEVFGDHADVFFKGIISSSLEYPNKTPFASFISTTGDWEVKRYIVLSFGGWASGIKPKRK